MNKRCPQCGETKVLSGEFWNRCVSRPDGFDSKCKQCKKLHSQSLSAKRSLLRRNAKRCEKDALKVKARVMAKNKFGSAKQWNCSVLACEKLSDDLHHIDYRCPFDVIPLCRHHHQMVHEK